MNWNRINIWTNTLYTLVHSLNISKKIAFGNLTTIDQGIDDARQWISPECSYESVLLVHPFGGAKITFRRDPNHHFEEIATQLIKMLIQDLVVIFDEMMLEVLIARGQHPAVFPQSKIEQLKPYLASEFEWAAQGCLELVACRNVLTHSSGYWNAKTIAIVRHFVVPIPKEGDKLIVGMPMLFRYRKAIRTFLNEVGTQRGSP